MSRITLITIIVGVTSIACVGSVLDRMQHLAPAPSLSFAEVVEIQLAALANDNESNDGIALAYRFAAPSNKRAVGPLERFITLFATELYAPMLDPLETEFLDSAERRNLAYQGVRIRSTAGRDFYYVFVLERQTVGEVKDCWMTIGVQTFSEAPRFQEELPGEVTSARSHRERRHVPSIAFFKPSSAGSSESQIPNNARLKSSPSMVLCSLPFLYDCTPVPGT